MSKIYVSQRTLENGCGLGYISNYRDYTDQWTITVKPKAVTAGGTGLFIGCFVNSINCKKVYEEACANHRLVFQTPMRRNNNSGRGFFTAMFDRSQSKKLKANMPAVEPNWPWKKTTAND